MKSLNLLASEEDFRHRWVKGMGTVVYNARSKSVGTFRDPAGGMQSGGFNYHAPWSEVDLTLTLDKLASYEPVTFTVNGEKIDLSDAIKKSGSYAIRIAVGSEKDVGLFVDGKLAGQAPIKFADRIELRFAAASTPGGILVVSGVKARAAAEPAPPPAKPKDTPPMKTIALLETTEDLAKHFRKGMGTTDFDPKSKVLAVETTESEVGHLVYKAAWEEIQFDIQMDKPHTDHFPHCYLQFRAQPTREDPGEVFDLLDAVKPPGKFRIRAVYLKNKTLSVFVNDKPIAPVATILKDNNVSTLDLSMVTNSASFFRLSNVRIKAQPEE
jgi:hypothetical protein